MKDIPAFALGIGLVVLLVWVCVTFTTLQPNPLGWSVQIRAFAALGLGIITLIAGAITFLPDADEY